MSKSPELEPVVQRFVAITADWVASVDAATESVARLAKECDAAVAAAGRLDNALADVAAEASNAADEVARLQATIDALHGRDIHVGVDVAGAAAGAAAGAGAGAGGMGAETAAAAAAAAAVDELAGSEWRANAAGQNLIDTSRAIAESEVIEAAGAAVLADAYQVQARAAALLAAESGSLAAIAGTSGDAANAAARGYNGWWGALGRVRIAQIGLYGGILGTVGGLHLLVDAVAEVAIVLTGAAVAMGVFGLAAAPTVEAIKNQMTNLVTVTEATGQALYPMTGQFQAMANAVKPDVYQLFGDALNIAARNGAGFTQMAVGTGAVLDQLAARFTVAVTSGNTFSTFLHNAVADVAGLGNIIGNLGGILGTVFRVMPGYAQVLLNVAGGLTHVAESAVSMAAPVIGAGLALHGAWLYAGLGVTVLSAAVRGGLTMIGNFAERAAMAAADSSILGGALQRAAPAMFGFSAGAAEAAALPWGWILTAAAGLGVLVYALVSAKDATQSWLASVQATLAAAPAASGMTAIMTAQAAESSRLASAQVQLSHTYHASAQVQMEAGRAGGYLNLAYADQARKVGELAGGNTQLADQARLYSYRLGVLTKTYGSASVAQGLLAASGIKMSAFLKYGTDQLAQIKAQVAAVSAAYTAMGQTGGVLGADMTVLNKLTSDQYVQMSKLNQAWTTFMGNSTGLMTGINGIITGMGNLNGQMKAAHASFTGVNANSLLLQNTFLQEITALQGVIGGMRLAGSSGHAMAQVLSTAVLPAVKHNALASAGLRAQLYAVARQAGYMGPDAIGPLTRYFEANATSERKMAKDASIAAAAAANLGTSSAAAGTHIAGLGRDVKNVGGELAKHVAITRISDLVTHGLMNRVDALSQGLQRQTAPQHTVNSGLQKQATQAHAAATNTQDLARQTQTAGSNAGTAAGKIATLAGNITTLGRDAATAAGNVHALASAIAGLQSKTITLTVNTVHTGTSSSSMWAPGHPLASGTMSASPGVHLVGEMGPELVMMHGGETVLPAPQTSHILAALAAANSAGHGSAPMEIHVHSHAYLDGEKVFRNVQRHNFRYTTYNSGRRTGLMVPS